MKKTTRISKEDAVLAEEGFYSRVLLIPFHNCWEWSGAKLAKGYGTYSNKNREAPKLAHRLSYVIHRSEIPEGMHIDHLCRNTGCVNPWHLEPVSIKENNRRSESPTAKNSRKKECRRGHTFTPENTYINKRGHRSCRKCSIIYQRELRKKLEREV